MTMSDELQAKIETIWQAAAKADYPETVDMLVRDFAITNLDLAGLLAMLLCTIAAETTLISDPVKKD